MTTGGKLVMYEDEGENMKKDFVLLPHCWVDERSFGWAPRFRRLARDYERLPEPLGLDCIS